MNLRHLTLRLWFSLLVLLMVPGIALSAPFVYVADTAGSWVSVIDLATDSIVQKVPLGQNTGPRNLAMHPNQPPRLYVSNYTEGTVSVIDVSDPTAAIEIDSISVGQNPEGLAFGPDGNKLYVTHGSGEVDINGIPTGVWEQYLTTIDVNETSGGYNKVVYDRKYAQNEASAPYDLTVKTHTNGRLTAFISGRLTDKIYVVDIENLNWVNPDPSDPSIVQPPYLNSFSIIDQNDTEKICRPHGLDVSSNGLIFAACRQSNELAIINTNVTPLGDPKFVVVGPSPADVALHPDGNSVYVVNSGDSTVSVIDISTTIYSPDLSPIPVGTDSLSNPEYISVGTNGNLAYVTGYVDNTLTLIDTSTDAVINTLDLADDSTNIADLLSDFGMQGVTSGDAVPYISVLESKNFGTVSLYEQIPGNFTITNKGTETLVISAIGGLSTDFFTLSTGNCLNANLNYSDTCTFTVTYVPTTQAVHQDSFTITTNASNGPTTSIAVAGTGTAVGVESPSTPESPGSVVSGNTVTFSWEESEDPFNRALTYRVEIQKGSTVFDGSHYFICDVSGAIISGSAFATVLLLGGAFFTHKRKTWMLAAIFAATTLLAACGGGGGGGGGTTPPPAADITSEAYTIVDGTGTYYWRVAAVADDGRISEFSSPLPFEIQ